MKVVGQQGILYYANNDSIYFAQPKELPLPCSIGANLGMFKEDYKNVTLFVCLAPRTFYVCTREPSGSMKSHVRASGISFKRKQNNYPKTRIYLVWVQKCQDMHIGWIKMASQHLKMTVMLGATHASQL